MYLKKKNDNICERFSKEIFLYDDNIFENRTVISIDNSKVIVLISTLEIQLQCQSEINESVSNATSFFRANRLIFILVHGGNLKDFTN